MFLQLGTVHTDNNIPARRLQGEVKFEKVLYRSSRLSLQLKPGLHIVATVAEHACDDASKRIVKLSMYPLQIFLVKHQYLLSLQRFEDQAISG